MRLCFGNDSQKPYFDRREKTFCPVGKMDIQKKIIVPRINSVMTDSEIRNQVNHSQKHIIGIINWPEFPYKPEVKFMMACSASHLYLIYEVSEQAIMALTDSDNGPVWKDSCVEFFVSPSLDEHYYNFEFNCIGACLLAFGNSRKEREYASPEILRRIRRFPSLGKKTFPEIPGDRSWNLFVDIPAGSLFKHPGLNFGEGPMKGNFYKCGDGLSVPHYLSWSRIETGSPDFHRPDFFSLLEFEK